jgi:alpha-tubulin suppressor-like RCC1 family protein
MAVSKAVRKDVTMRHQPARHSYVSMRPAVCLSTVLAVLVACSQDPTGPGGLPPLSPALVSAPVSGAPGGAAGLRLGVAYVAMVPGTDLAGVSVTVRNGPAGLSVDGAMVDGGFDPIAIAAQPGDSLFITVHRSNGAVVPGYVVVPARTRPAVVRTSPPQGKTDVVLNSRITVIFSQPMDRASLPGALHLHRGGAEVAGTVTVSPGGGEMLGADFVPAGLLAPLTTYQFEVSTAALGQNGEPLAAPVQVDFTTGSDAAAVATVTITPSPLQLVVGGQQQLSAVPVNAAGTPLTTSCAWATSDAAVADISSTGLLSALTPGTVLIRATCGGVSAEDPVTVVRIPTGDLVFASVSAGDIHTCGLTINGAAYCWGDNTNGELGDGTTASSLTPVAVAGGLTFRVLSAGEQSTCGVTTTGAAYCWGFGGNGELGNGTYSTSPVTKPVRVSGGLTFTSVTIGGFGAGFACGLVTSGALYCWGYGVWGEFGGDWTQTATPVAAAGGLTFAAVSAGGDHMCGITHGGAAICWGNNILGQVGDGTYGNNRPPVAVLGGLTFAAIAARGQSSCGITTAGALYCWGWITDGTTAHQICVVGIERVRNMCSTVPAAVAGGRTFASVSPGFSSSCAVAPAGAAYCWGQGLGPVAVAGGLTFAGVSAGLGSAACGVTTGGIAYCWGDNSSGQLGNGTTTSSSVPVKVAYQP